MPSPAFLSRIASSPIVLAPGVPQVIDLDIAGARAWCAVVRNVGANPVDGGSVARSPLGGLFDDAVPIPGASLPAAGQSMGINGADEPITTLRLTLSSTLGTTLSLEAGGW